MPSRVFPTAPEAAELVVGPDSLAWRFGSDPRLYWTVLYPLLMQVAHPTVGAGVRDFSDFERRPWDRLMRSIDYLNLLIYGGSEAIETGHRLRALHRRFRGAQAGGGAYSALEPGAYAWVHATLIDAYVAGHAHFGRPMKAPERQRFYAEYRGLGRLIGVRERDLPLDYEAFRAYFEHTAAHELEHNQAVDRVLASVRGPAPPPLPMPGPLWRALRIPVRRALLVCGLGLLPAALRERFGVSWSWREEAEFRSLAGASRALGPLVPRVTGPAQLRWRRGAIAGGPLGPRS